MNIDLIKSRYPVGTKVRLISMKDEFRVPPETIGTITLVDDVGTLHVNWENGSTLGLIVDEDDFEIISTPVIDYEVTTVDFEVQAPIYRKLELDPQPNQVNFAIKVSLQEYFDLLKYPFKDRSYIAYFKEHMYQDEISVNQCILVYTDEIDNGILINSEGYEYARYQTMINNVHDLLELNSYTGEENENRFLKIKVLVVEPNMKPYVAIIDNDLKSFQSMVGGHIETLALSETADIICNEEGKLINLPPNRRIRDDIIVGRFMVVGNNNTEHFSSITKEDIDKYYKQFETFEDIDYSEVEKTLKYEFTF